ncbi:hypothetical protein FQA39_LY01866 [Lamprigera yunnana]|nr:hypothetical protein FQA39_LY01866 [Lamprigera yunnana]
MFMQIPSPENRSISPYSTSPSREIRGLKLFRAISRKLARKSHEDINLSEDADSRSCSTDSSSSTSAGRCTKSRKTTNSEFMSSPQRMSSSSSDTGSDTQSVKHRHSTSVENFRRAFQNLTVSSRSQSCGNGKEAKRKQKKSSPKKILRSPVAYTYVKGLSGLPTQRSRAPSGTEFANDKSGWMQLEIFTKWFDSRWACYTHKQLGFRYYGIVPYNRHVFSDGDFAAGEVTSKNKNSNDECNKADPVTSTLQTNNQNIHYIRFQNVQRKRSEIRNTC